MRHELSVHPDELRALKEKRMKRIEQPYRRRKAYVTSRWASLRRILHADADTKADMEFAFFLGAHCALQEVREDPERIPAMEAEIKRFLSEHGI